MNSFVTFGFRKSCAALVAVAMVFQPLGAYGAAITTSSLAEKPLLGESPVKPNIMYTLDESGSMSADYLPDYISLGDDKSGINKWCRDPLARTANCSKTVSPSTMSGNPPYASSNFNKMYYDPAVRYSAGIRVGADGSTSNLPFQAGSGWTNVYVDGFAGYPGPNPGTVANGGAINLVTGYPDEIYCTKSNPIVPDETDTAKNSSDGSVCRYNGKPYPGAPAGYNYPNATYTNRVPVKGGPYYYTISSVKFCPAPNSVGWGANGPQCTTRWSPTNLYVSFGASDFDPTAFARIDIDTNNAQEMNNFATWYAFARTRMLAMKTAGGTAFSALDARTRVGFNTINTFATNSNFLNIRDFTAANKTAWFTKFYSVAPIGETPTIDAMWRVGEYFANRGAAAGLPGATDPLDAATGQCQLNYHLMSTDGYWFQSVVDRPGIGNQDLNAPDPLPGPIPKSVSGQPAITAGQPFPLPYREGSGSDTTSNTMADVAMFYWINDIRPDFENKVKDKDSIATWQHVTLYGLSIGAVGTFDSNSRDAVTGAPASVVSGTPWPKPVTNTPTAIDDLWHAAVSSRGKYLNAQTADDLARKTVRAVNELAAPPSGTGSAVGIPGNGGQLTAGYLTYYAPIDWSGDVRKYALDVNTGAVPVDADGNPTQLPVWSAKSQLDGQAAGTGWNTNRRIVTMNSDTDTPVPFRLANLSATQKASLTAGWSSVTPPPTDQQVLDYLRGDPSHDEDHVDVAAVPSAFRARSHVLGDIVYSAAVPVGSPWDARASAPVRPLDDAGNPGYRRFAEEKKLRTPMVYVAANDGMLHAFVDSAGNIAGPNDGKEAWAYIPKAVFEGSDPNDSDHPRGSPSSPFEFDLAALTYRSDLLPTFKHRFYVNATPRVWDIDFANTNTRIPPDESGARWRTILVGGLGAGGRTVYALDVTDPIAPPPPFSSSDTEATAARKVLWEFTDKDHPGDLGYVFDAPTLVKTFRYGWVVLVASGYNNSSGKGILYVLDPKNGAILKRLSPDDPADLDPLSARPDPATATNPRGLSTIRAFTTSRKNPYVLQAYGGDLSGNVWRFDLSDPDESKWKVALIAKLAVGGVAQPITTGVRVEIDQNNNVDRYLFVGTGKLLDQADVPDAPGVTNSMYVIRDGTRTAAGPVPLSPYTRADLNTVDGTKVTGFSGTSTRGWYQDGRPGEKVITDVAADVQTVVYSFSKSTAECENVLTSTLFARDFTTGNSALQPQGGTGAVVASIGDVGAVAGVALIQGASGDVRLQVTTTAPSPKYGQVFSFGVKLAGGPSSKHRVSWRLINRD